MTNQTYNPFILISAAREYLHAEEAYHHYESMIPYSDSNPTYTEYRVSLAIATTLSATFETMCSLINADQNTIIAVVKAMNRHDRRNHWTTTTDLGQTAHTRKQLCRALTRDYDPYYRSTGRRKAWTK